MESQQDIKELNELGKEAIKILADIDHILTHSGEIKINRSIHNRIKLFFMKNPSIKSICQN